MITRELLRAWDACYSDEDIARLVPVGGLTPLEVCDLDILAIDKLWVLLREEILPHRTLRLLACRWAEKACKAAGLEDVASGEAITVARRYANGEGDRASLEELAAAYNAAQQTIRRLGDGPTLLWSAARVAARVAGTSRTRYAYLVAKNVADTDVYAAKAPHKSHLAQVTHEAACLALLADVRTILEELSPPS